MGRGSGSSEKEDQKTGMRKRERSMRKCENQMIERHGWEKMKKDGEKNT